MTPKPTRVMRSFLWHTTHGGIDRRVPWVLLGVLAAMGGCMDRPVGTPRPETSNIFVKQTQTAVVDKIDVLFVVDNSLSMGDKQQVLAAAVPQLLGRLTNPDCTAPGGGDQPPFRRSDPSEVCPDGLTPEFSPVVDIHLGVITSSLGASGGDYCEDDDSVASEAAQNDHAWLVGAMNPTRTGLADSSPFLDWSPVDAASYATSIQPRTEEFRSLVTAAGELGCGYEMSLESWYRFLVDPIPPVDVVRVDPTNRSSIVARTSTTDPEGGVDQNILAQRAAFLRPDSLLAIVMLSDENDCSLQDHGNAYWPALKDPINRATSVCDTNPNDPCCYSCNFDDDGERPTQCPADPVCHGADKGLLAKTDDPSTLRCYEQQRRFGWDLLMPTSRYINALTRSELCVDRDDLHCVSEQEDPDGYQAQTATRLKNPIFSPADPSAVMTGIPRLNPDLVFLAGIVGVPWQDIATDQSLVGGAELEYQKATEINWDLLLPTDPGDQADDPLMRESTEPRSGQNPRTGALLAGPDSPRDANPINLHEWLTEGQDLQFACAFDLSQPLSDEPNPQGLPGAARDCNAPCGEDALCLARTQSCSCRTADKPGESKSPLCQNPADQSFGNIQYAAKAYPSVRQLEVLRGYSARTLTAHGGNNAIVASICPKSLAKDDRAGRGYGYNPAVRALVDRLKVHLSGTCLPRPLDTDDQGKLPCAVVEAITPAQSPYCACIEKGRVPVSAALAESVRRQLRDSLLCDVEGRPTCAETCLCELPQLNDDEACLSTPGIEKSASSPGYCYVDPGLGFGSPEVVSACPPERKRMLRIVGNSDGRVAPAPGSTVFVACAGSSYDKDEAAPAE